MNMKLGFNEATTLENSTLAQDLVYCEKHGFDYIEIRIDKLKEYLIDHTLDDLQSFFEHSNIKPLAFNALEFFNFRNKTTFENMKEELRWLNHISNAIGCPYVVAVPSLDIGDKSSREIFEESVQKLKELASCLEDSELKLALEFIGYPNASINTLEQAWNVIQALNHNKIGLVVDCFHLYGMNSRISGLKEIDPEKIFLLHINDSEDIIPGMVRDHNRVWPGDGVIDLKLIIQTIESIGYKGPATIELFRREYWELEAEETIKQSMERMRKLFQICI